MQSETNTFSTRESLLARLRHWEDGESWKDFFDTYEKLIYNVAIHSGLSRVEANDIVQDTMICVAKQISGFQYDKRVGSFRAWLRVVARRRVVDYLRKRRDNLFTDPAPDNAAQVSALEDFPDLSSEKSDELWEQQWRQSILDVALAEVRLQINPKHYQIFELYVLKEWQMAEVIRTLGVNRAEVYVTKHRISALLQKRTKALLKEWEPGLVE